MGDSEPVIMSEFSSDTDPDMEDELCRLQPLQAPVSPLSTTTSVGVMTSQSRYPAPAVPVVPVVVSSGLTCFRFMNRLRIRCCTSQ